MGLWRVDIGGRVAIIETPNNCHEDEQYYRAITRAVRQFFGSLECVEANKEDVLEVMSTGSKVPRAARELVEKSNE